MKQSPVDQTDLFRSDEGDNWFRRNRAALASANAHDAVLQMVAAATAEGARFKSICELGCANGWRLAELRDRLPDAARVAGSDISAEAIADGSGRWPGIELAVGSLDEPAIHGRFDLVIVSFVLHWVSRELLARSVAAIDNLVADGGALVIADFLPDAPCARRYHHRQDVKLFTYKQDYFAAFTGLGIYRQEKSQIFAHSAAKQPKDSQDRAACALLRKSLIDGYSVADPT